MPEYNNTINNLNRKLFFKFNKIKIKPLEDEKETTVENYLTHAFQHHYGGNRSIGTQDTGFIDVPDVSSVDDEYTTNRPAHIKPDHDVKVRPQTNPEEDEKKDAEDADSPISVDIGEGGDINRFDKENIDLREKARKEFLRRQKAAKAKRNVREQGEEPAPEAEPPAEEPAPEDMGAEPDMGGDPGMGDPGIGDPGIGDPNAMMPMEEEPADPNELGRTYEMKKIYSRLVSMNQYLADEMSPKIYKTKHNIAKAIDLFAVIGANPDSYTERIDEIIIGYYKFLESAYKTVKSYYRAEANRVGGLPKNEEQKDDKDTEATI
jgi:hypothetical protein